MARIQSTTFVFSGSVDWEFLVVAMERHYRPASRHGKDMVRSSDGKRLYQQHCDCFDGVGLGTMYHHKQHLDLMEFGPVGGEMCKTPTTSFRRLEDVLPTICFDALLFVTLQRCDTGITGQTQIMGYSNANSLDRK